MKAYKQINFLLNVEHKNAKNTIPTLQKKHIFIPYRHYQKYHTYNI